MKADDVKQSLQKLANPEKAKILQGFFKTGKGEYGEGDIFLGITVPEQRKVAKKYANLPFIEMKKMLKSEVHEHRLVSLLILVESFKKGTVEKRAHIHNFYLANTTYVNNWDLVDLTAPVLVGEHLLDKDRKVLYELAKSSLLWDKRIAIVGCFPFIRNKDPKDALKLATIFLKETHDLMHKATGWMLREVGKHCGQETLETFLKKHYATMPRTMLRYAIERFPETRRQAYLKGTV